MGDRDKEKVTVARKDINSNTDRNGNRKTDKGKIGREVYDLPLPILFEF